MNLKLRRPLLGMIAALAVAGGAVGMAASLKTVANPVLAANEVSALASTATTVEMSSFSATSGNLDAVVSYETGKGGGTTAPAISGGEIRLYQNSSGTGGGFITVKAADGYLLSEVKIGSSMATTIRYTVDDGAESTKESLSANGVFNLSGISAQSVTFTCYGTTKSSRLYVNYLSATYVSSTPIVDDEKATSLTLSQGTGRDTIEKGGELDPTGYEVGLVYTSESDELYSRQEPIDPADERLTWNYDSSTLGLTDLTVTFRDGDVELTSNAIQIEVSAAAEYRFGEHEDFLAEWDGKYQKRSLAFTGSTGEQLFDASFSGANKQPNGNEITDMPVSKGGTLTITSTKDMLGIEFGFKQWTTKTQTVTLTVGTHSEEMSFPSDGTSIAYVGDTAFKEAVVSMSDSDNQIGWEYVSITWAPEASSDANAFAEAFLEEPLCDGGVTAPDVETWDTLAALYEETLTEEDKAFFTSAVPDEEGTLVEQCVARYDYIVGKYGSDVYQDFMGRSPEPLKYGLDVRSQMPEGTTAWICAASLLAATAVLGGAFIAKRRKESR